MSREIYRQHYSNNVPVFDREVLVKLKEQLDQGSPEVKITVFDGTELVYDMTKEATVENETGPWPEFPKEIEYTTIQELLTSDAKRFPIDMSPSVLRLYGSVPGPTLDLSAATRSYHENSSIWQQSKTCSSLMDHLGSIKLPRITKIVCFGLGTLHLDRSDRRLLRPHSQYAAIETMRAHLTKTQPSVAVTVLCQDPGYREIDKKILTSLDMTAVDDPTGFVEIDGETLVYSVSPGACVRQVVADMPRPAALFCNTIHPTLLEEFTNESEYFKQKSAQTSPGGPPIFIMDGEVHYRLPMTDPSSRRVREMISNYTAWPLPEDNNFGDLTFYVRK